MFQKSVGTNPPEQLSNHWMPSSNIKHSKRIEKKSLRNCQTTPTIRLQAANGKVRIWMRIDKVKSYDAGNSKCS
jgi:hypothetical protein